MLATPLIVNLAPTGAVADHRKNPLVPVTREAIVDDVVAATMLGATIAHLHVRNADATPSSNPNIFADLIGALRQRVECHDMILCATTSGRHGQTPEALSPGISKAHGARVGLEDNLWANAQKEPASNTSLVKGLVDRAAAAGRGIATKAQVRAIPALSGLQTVA